MRGMVPLVWMLVLLGPAISAAQVSGAEAHDAGLGRKADRGGPSEELAGDTTREEKDEAKRAEEERPALQYDIFRFTVELQLKDKREELLRTLEQMAPLAQDPKEKADLLFRIAELHWEEAQYWGFESHRQDDRIARCLQANDEACKREAERVQAEYAENQRRHQNLAIDHYKQVIATHPEYERMDEVLFFLGYTLWEADQKEEALGAYRTLLTRFPDSRFAPDAYIAFGEWYFDNSEGKRDMLEAALEAYTRAASYTDARVYGYAIYKQGWCLYNLTDYAGAADKFKATVYYGEVTTAVGGDNKMALVREARKDYVLAYSRFGDPTRAKDAFRDVGGDEHWRSMLEQLANIYYDDGKDREAVLVYRELIRDQPLSPRAPFYQSRIVDSVMRVGNKRITAEQARILVDIFLEVRKAGVIRTREDEIAMERAEELSERTLSSLAVNWHNEAKKTRDPETFELASRIYADYLAIFPNSPKAYHLRFFYGELLYDPLERFEAAAQAYTEVALEDIARKERGEEPGQWFVPALEGAIFANDELMKRAEQTQPPPDTDRKEPLPIPPEKQGFLDAAERYLAHVLDGDMRVEVAYKAARIYYLYNHFDKAVEGFARIALEHPEHELAIYSAHLVLDAFNLQENWEAIDEWAKRFYAEKRLHRGNFREELLEIIERNSFQLIARLEQAGKYSEAAERYVTFVREWPNSQLAGEALFNAAVDFYKAGRIEEALDVRNRLVRQYPGHKLVPQAIFLNASVYESIGDYAAAAGLHEAYVDGWVARQPGYEEEKARAALNDAAIFREALGDLDTALQNRRRFLELWPNDQAAPAMHLSVARLLSRTGAHNRALLELDAFEKRYLRDADKMILGEAAIIDVYLARGSQRAADRIRERMLKYYRELSRSRRESLSPEALEAVARAMLVETEPHDRWFQSIKLALPERVMAQRLEAKANALLEVERRYTAVVQLGAPGPAVCALTRIGKAYDHFARSLYDAPIPAGLTEEQEAIYREALAEQAMPVETKSQEALATAVAKARELGLDDECSREALSLLESRAPHLYPPLVGDPAPAFERPDLGIDLLTERQKVEPPPEGAVLSSAVEETIPGLRERPRPQVEEGPKEPVLEGEPDDDDLL